MLRQKLAFGSPGIDPRWARSDKYAIITAYSASSPIRATLSAGIVNEVYYPSIDKPQVRDLQFLVTDGEIFFHDERRGTDSKTERICGESLGYRVVNVDADGRYRIEKQIIPAPHAACLLIQTRFLVSPPWQGKLKLFALIAPHLCVGGQDNNGNVERHRDRLLLTANRDDNWLAMDCSSGFVRGSCGYVGNSDGWTDLADNFRMDWEYETATEGNIALIGEVELSTTTEFCLAVGFGSNQHGAVASLTESLAIPFDEHLTRFRDQWSRTCCEREDRSPTSHTTAGIYSATATACCFRTKTRLVTAR